MVVALAFMLGISSTQFETGAAGTAYFEPGGVLFRDFSGKVAGIFADR